MGNSFGKIFKVNTFGESHGGAVGVILDGCPPRLKLDIDLIQDELNRRRPGQSQITTPRKEEDKLEILSGIKDNITLGTPIAMIVRNKDQRPGDYSNIEKVFRPSHADGTYHLKYGIQADSGGGRASNLATGIGSPQFSQFPYFFFLIKTSACSTWFNKCRVFSSRVSSFSSSKAIDPPSAEVGSGLLSADASDNLIFSLSCW